MSTALLSFEKGFVSSRLERSLWYLGSLMTVHADASDTNGAFALFEVSGKPGAEPPLHVHQNEDELFYVLEGRLIVTRGDEQVVLEAGDTGFLPRMVPHTFRVASESARMLVYITPAGFEEYFRAIGRPAQRLTADPNPPAPDFIYMEKVANRMGVTFLK